MAVKLISVTCPEWHEVNRTTFPSDFVMMEKAGLHLEIIKSEKSPRLTRPKA